MHHWVILNRNDFILFKLTTTCTYLRITLSLLCRYQRPLSIAYLFLFLLYFLLYSMQMRAATRVFSIYSSLSPSISLSVPHVVLSSLTTSILFFYSFLYLYFTYFLNRVVLLLSSTFSNCLNHLSLISWLYSLYLKIFLYFPS